MYNINDCIALSDNQEIKEKLEVQFFKTVYDILYSSLLFKIDMFINIKKTSMHTIKVQVYNKNASF